MGGYILNSKIAVSGKGFNPSARDAWELFQSTGIEALVAYDCSGAFGLAVVVVESAVTSIYVCYAEDPSLIQRWDAEFFDQMSEALHQRLQYRSARAREVMNHSLDQLSDTPPPI
ncbi:hypothetical protein BHM03_00038696 [Ensete ventricosum]|nr:hypothetical protein BHM03_00038696 [Ensete ventricosum]